MDKRVYGVLGISSIMANWNADFTGYPKTTTSGDVFGSDKALKYTIKKMWENQGEKILYIKSLKKETLTPRTLGERYEYLFEGEDLKKEKDVKVILKNLFCANDVKNFGATFAESKANISITGAVQIGQGFNKYSESEAQEQNILSPFQDSKAVSKNKNKEDGKEEEAKNTTLGTKIVSDEAHYFYPFTINSDAYKEYVEMGVTEGYTEEDYEKFKKASLTSATSFATNSKIGCENEFGLFVETDKELYLPNLDRYIEFIHSDDKNTIVLNITEMLSNVQEHIKSVKVYYNPYTTNIEFDYDKKELYDIITLKEI